MFLECQTLQGNVLYFSARTNYEEHYNLFPELWWWKVIREVMYLGRTHFAKITSVYSDARVSLILKWEKRVRKKTTKKMVWKYDCLTTFLCHPQEFTPPSFQSHSRKLWIKVLKYWATWRSRLNWVTEKPCWIVQLLRWIQRYDWYLYFQVSWAFQLFPICATVHSLRIPCTSQI